MPVDIDVRKTEVPDITSLLRESAAIDKAYLDAVAQKNSFTSDNSIPNSFPTQGQNVDPNTMVSPIDQRYRISQEFGNYNPGLYAGRTQDARHYGLDVATPSGTPVKSPFAGLVKVGENKDFGKFVEIRTQDGQIMRFSHLSSIADLASKLGEVGQQIQAGQTLGLTGNTGYSTAPHLDIMYQRGGQWTNPLQFDPLRRQLGS